MTPQAQDGYFQGKAIVETSGLSSANETMVTTVAPGATHVLVSGATDIPGLVILTRELDIRIAEGGGRFYPEALELVAVGY